MRTVIFIALIILSPALAGQDFTQTVRGLVKDKFTQSPIPGATVVMHDSTAVRGAATGSDGYFELNEVPIGRQSFTIRFIGYKNAEISQVIVVSGKETFLLVELEEQYMQLDEVVVAATPKGDALNELAYASSRSFSVEDTERYAGTNGDPARMASYFAGVMATGDARNDIIVRGNTPLGLLWRLEGAPIPNPNHFALMGTNGGAMSILNNNLLSNSDFMTGAFPAEYGNALSGVFDLNMRTGNNQKHQTMAQMGMGGLEAGLEGPFSKARKSSYLIHYRHAFLGLFEKIGISLPSGTPRYKDLSWKMNFPTQKAGTLSFWGLGGKSQIQTLGENSGFKFDDYMNARLASGMGASGLTHRMPVKKQSYLQTSLSISGYTSQISVDSAGIDGPASPFYASHFNEWRTTASTVFKTRLSENIRASTGANYVRYHVNYRDSVLIYPQYISLTDNNGQYGLAGAFGQLEWLVSEAFKMTAGLHGQYLVLNKSRSLEPRVAWQYDLNDKTTLHSGYGLHSMTQAGNVYFLRSETDSINHTGVESNRHLGFSKSHHFVAGLDHFFTNNLRLKTDIYYQYLFQIPVEERPSSYSTINFGGDFTNIIMDSLINEGTGRNLGMEFTLEKFYYHNSYYMFTASFFDSKYSGSDGILRNTLYNSNYVFNALGGYEFKIKNTDRLSLNLNVVWAGGLRYLPIDLDKSIEKGQTVYDMDNPYHSRSKDFVKVNLKIIQRINREKFSIESGFEINNILNRKNFFMQSFNPATGSIQTDYQMGIMPGGMFRIYF